MTDIDLSLNQRFSSSVLWHFTGYEKTEERAFEILQLILESKILKVAKDPEPIKMADGADRPGFPIVCMCDIPFQDLGIHMARYGNCGIAFHKESAIKMGGLTPVWYLQSDSKLFSVASVLVSGIEKTISRDHPAFKLIQPFLLFLGSYAKRTDFLHPATISPEKDRSQDNNFYYEREWRTVEDWAFKDSDIAAIMMPSQYFSRFKERWRERFPVCSIISSEMVGIL